MDGGWRENREASAAHDRLVAAGPGCSGKGRFESPQVGPQIRVFCRGRHPKNTLGQLDAASKMPGALLGLNTLDREFEDWSLPALPTGNFCSRASALTMGRTTARGM